MGWGVGEGETRGKVIIKSKCDLYVVSCDMAIQGGGQQDRAKTFANRVQIEMAR